MSLLVTVRRNPVAFGKENNCLTEKLQPLANRNGLPAKALRQEPLSGSA